MPISTQRARVFGVEVSIGTATDATTGTAVSRVVDTDRANFARFIIVHQHATAANGSNAFQALQLQECDTSDGTFSAVEGYQYTTGTASDSQFSASLSQSSTVPFSVVMDVDVRGRHRYLQLAWTPDNLSAIDDVFVVCELEQEADSYATAHTAEGVIAYVGP